MTKTYMGDEFYLKKLFDVCELLFYRKIYLMLSSFKRSHV